MRKRPLYSLIHTLPLAMGLLLFACKPAAKMGSSAGTAEKISDQQLEVQVEHLFIDGCKDRMASRLDVAEAKFRQALKLSPANVAVKYELATIALLTGRLDEATALAKECVEAEPKNQWYHLKYIECLHLKRQHPQAAEAYERLVKYFPDKVEFYESMAIEYAMASNFQRSFKIYDELEKRFGYNETFTLNKIKLLREQKKYSEAETELSKLIQAFPKEPRYYSYLAEYYEDMGDFEKARAVYNKLLLIDPNNPMVHLALANYYKDQGKMNESHSELRLAFANPDLEVEKKLRILVSYYGVSEEYKEQGKTELYNDFKNKGYELCAIMLKVHATAPEAHSIYADYLLRDNKLTEARDQLFMAAQYDKSRWPIWDQLLRVESELGQSDSVEHHSAQAMELFPSQPLPYLFNGTANLRSGNYQKASQALNDGLEFVYDNKALMIDFYSKLGDAYFYLKNYERSDRAFDDALKVDPDSPPVLNQYAYYLALRGEKLEKAEKLARRACEIVPKEANYLDTYGWVLYKEKKYQEAEDWLARAVKGTKNYNIIEHYGDLLFRLGKTEEALNYWKQAKEAGNVSERLAKKINEKKLDD